MYLLEMPHLEDIIYYNTSTKESSSYPLLKRRQRRAAIRYWQQLSHYTLACYTDLYLANRYLQWKKHTKTHASSAFPQLYGYPLTLQKPYPWVSVSEIDLHTLLQKRLNVKEEWNTKLTSLVLQESRYQKLQLPVEPISNNKALKIP